MRMRLLTLLVLALGAGATAQDAKPFDEKLKGFTRKAGLLTTHINAKTGRVMLELAPKDLREYLYASAIRTGLGSNDVGLDRGQLGPSHLIRIRRVADRVLFEVPNLDYRAISNDPAEQRAVRESFATSILWAGRIEAEAEDGRVLVDLTPFLVRDAHDVVGSLRATSQGSFSLDRERSTLDPENCLSFPKNLEFESILTFTGSQPGGFVRSVAPIPEAWSLVQHISIVELPEPGYKPRVFDPRAGAFALSFSDYASPISSPLMKRWAVRHRLEKVNPNAEKSPAKEPIVYYVDNGAPEPIRSALLDGARWWAAAFEEAGFENGYRVEVLPEGAHPLDARYNVIQWVHRSTRGWSYGASLVDPRTGEIIKGHVSLGSLRVRQDRLIFEGLLGADKTDSGAPDDPVQLSLARIRQLSAHEIGHTIGLAHNFAASTYGRGSVMDYPAPHVKPAGTGLDVSDVYGVGVGSWDKFAIKWLYSEFPSEAMESRGLSRMVEDSIAKGLVFLTDADARSLGSADPRASLWDNGPDPVAGLREAMEVRRRAIESFGERSIGVGQALALLQEVFAPIYLYHRYQVEAAVKNISGVEYAFAHRGDGQTPMSHVAPIRQREALAALGECLQPTFLDIPDRTLALLGPRPFGHGGNREMFGSRVSPMFDPLAAAESAADIVVNAVLNADRLARLAVQRRHDPEIPSAGDVINHMVDSVASRQESERLAAIRGSTQAVMAARLMDLAMSTSGGASVQGEAVAGLRRLRSRLVSGAAGTALREEIDRFLARPAGAPWTPARPIAAPPGSPIGWGDCSMGG